MNLKSSVVVIIVISIRIRVFRDKCRKILIYSKQNNKFGSKNSIKNDKYKKKNGRMSQGKKLS